MRISILDAAQLISKGNIVAVPTETVYGLAASLKNPTAIEKIFTLKGRPANNPLIIHVNSPTEVESFATNIPPSFYDLAKTFWPGPMTVVLDVDINTIDAKARAGLSTAAFRIPNHPVTQKLLQIAGPLVMPSANISGKPSATSPEHVEHDFGPDFPVLDGGKCSKGVESTILIFVEGLWKIIRLGSIPSSDFKDVLGYTPLFEEADRQRKPLCPGQLYRHYAPKAKLILTEIFNSSMSGTVIGFSNRKYPQKLQLIGLGKTSYPEEAAENLYAVLRNLDEQGIQEAFVDIDVPKEGLWITILERLKKAGQPAV